MSIATPARVSCNTKLITPISGSYTMFLPQPTTIVTAFTGMNYSLPIHKTLVVTEKEMSLDFTMVNMANTKEWVFEILKIDKMNGEITLKKDWKKIIWTHHHKLKQRGKGHLIFRNNINTSLAAPGHLLNACNAHLPATPHRLLNPKVFFDLFIPSMRT